MRNLIFKLVLPLTVISFALITKWWYTIPIDAPHTMFTGFPWPYTCPGWHTSMSMQIFIVEFVADFFIYFLFWFIIIYFINRFIKIRMPNLIPITLWVFSSIFIVFGVFMASDESNIFHLNRTFEIRVLDSGIRYNWKNMERPEYNDYIQEENK